tara:strand:- start:62 stop:250 length:189 start_codon:yes stop_codon:yes gene_type:complete
LDVAQKTGIIRVFTPGAFVSKTMAAKVRTAARELVYIPNVLAQRDHRAQLDHCAACSRLRRI